MEKKKGYVCIIIGILSFMVCFIKTEGIISGLLSFFVPFIGFFVFYKGLNELGFRASEKRGRIFIIIGTALSVMYLVLVVLFCTKDTGKSFLEFFVLHMMCVFCIGYSLFLLGIDDLKKVRAKKAKAAPNVRANVHANVNANANAHKADESAPLSEEEKYNDVKAVAAVYMPDTKTASGQLEMIDALSCVTDENAFDPEIRKKWQNVRNDEDFSSAFADTVSEVNRCLNMPWKTMVKMQSASPVDVLKAWGALECYAGLTKSKSTYNIWRARSLIQKRILEFRNWGAIVLSAKQADISAPRFGKEECDKVRAAAAAYMPDTETAAGQLKMIGALSCVIGPEAEKIKRELQWYWESRSASIIEGLMSTTYHI